VNQYAEALGLKNLELSQKKGKDGKDGERDD